MGLLSTSKAARARLPKQAFGIPPAPAKPTPTAALLKPIKPKANARKPR